MAGKLGLGHLETLIENLNRELDMGTGTIRQKLVPSWLTNGDADLTVTEALHSGKVVYQADVGADRTYTIATPSAAGVTYRFVGSGTGAAADGHAIILDFADDACYFKGTVTHLDTNADNVNIWGNGTSHDRLTLNIPASYDIELVALSTTVMYITGNVVSATVPAFAAQD